MACLMFFLLSVPALAWHDETHLAIARAAGYEKYYNAVGPDMIKAASIETGNHYFNNNAGAVIAMEMVLQQARRYDQPGDAEGHLLGAIIAALRKYDEVRASNKYAECHLAFAAHYIGDLSQPLHNTPYDVFNTAHHAANDGIIEAEVLNNLSRIERHMYEIKLDPGHCELALAVEIARIANMAREFGNRLRKEDRDMTKDEAYILAGHSASLFKAWLTCCRQGRN